MMRRVTQLTLNISTASAAITAPPMRNRSRRRRTQVTVASLLAWPRAAEHQLTGGPGGTAAPRPGRDGPAVGTGHRFIPCGR